MIKTTACILSIMISVAVFAQKTLSVQVSYAPGILNIVSPPIYYNFYNSEITHNVSADMLYYVHDNIQIETSISYSSFNCSYTYNFDGPVHRGTYKADADIYSTNNVLSIPFGMSFVYPYKKNKFLLGLKLVPQFVTTNQKGYYHSSGSEIINSDSTYYFENYYVDNEIRRLTYPKVMYQFFIGYEYQFNNRVGFSIRYENARGKMVGVEGSAGKYNNYSLRMGVFVQLIDYTKRDDLKNVNELE